jgi:NhaC family Na+:H+ antiporter
VSYLPFCVFNILSPILDVLFGFIGFKIPTLDSTEPTGGVAVRGADEPEPGMAPG